MDIVATENWVPIAKVPNYEVSDLGYVRPVVDIYRGRGCGHRGHVSRPAFVPLVPKPPNRTRHYPYVNLRYEETTYEVAVCRAVWEAFRGPLSMQECIEFIDGDSDNAALANLQVVIPGSRFDRQAVAQMRREYGDGASVTELAERYRVPVRVVSRLCSGRSWKHLEVRHRSCLVCGTTIDRTTPGPRRYCTVACRDVVRNLTRRRSYHKGLETARAKLAGFREDFSGAGMVDPKELWPLLPPWKAWRLARETGLNPGTAKNLLRKKTRLVQPVTAAAIRALHQRLVAATSEVAGD